MMTIPPGEIMGQVHIADRSDEAHAMKGADAWKCYRCNNSPGYNRVLNIDQPVNGSPTSRLMTIFRDGASQLLNVPPDKRFNE